MLNSYLSTCFTSFLLLRISLSDPELQNSPEATWHVLPSNNIDDQPCLLMSGNISIVFVHPGEDLHSMSEDVQRLHWRMKVPDDAASYGVCGDAKTEVSLSWRHEDKERWNEGKNLINLVVTKNFRLAELTGVFARVYFNSKKYELTSNMEKYDEERLSWPHRYCLSCQKTLMYPVYNVYEVKKNHNLRKDDDVPPKAFLVVQNLMWEVFRQDSSVENQKVNSTKSKSRSFANMKRQWECQFLKICLWTPYLTTGTLAFLVIFMFVCLMFKSYLGCSDYDNDNDEESDNNNGYQKL